MAASRKRNASVPSQSTFAETLLKIGYRFSLPRVFDDFLTMAIAACTRNVESQLSYYEGEYLDTILYYKDSALRYEFPKAFSQLILEMEERVHSDIGNDVLGEFFEQHISHGRNGQIFTTAPICQFMASITHANQVDLNDTSEQKPLRILDPACGSGRMLLAAYKTFGSGHEYYGIDIDRTCVKMTALNLFLNGMWNSEVLCANALLPDDFVSAYRISFVPLGIFKIEEKEKAVLWHLQRNSFSRKEKKPGGTEIILDATPFTERKRTDSTQLDLF
jgi:type I restriction-modification system DNA methylase subunit